MTDTEAYRATLDRLTADLVKAEDTIVRAREEVTRAEAYAERIRGGIAAITSILDEDAPAVTVRPLATAPERAEGVRAIRSSMTLEEAAEVALRIKGEPLHVREIYDVLMQNGYPYKSGFETFKGSMFPTLNRSARFARIGKGLYTLAERAQAHKAQNAENTLGLG